MEAYFDNRGNILTASLRITRDDSAIYTLHTTFGLRGRKLTVLKDENPPLGRAGSSVGCILWNEKVIEIGGTRKSVKDIRRVEGGLFKMNKSSYWRWMPEGKEFEVRYDQEGWKATLDNNMSIAARFLVPSRPHLFSKPEPPSLHLTKPALEADEVFLILLLIYSEIKRQDRTGQPPNKRAKVAESKAAMTKAATSTGRKARGKREIGLFLTMPLDVIALQEQ
ncbi:hypothetical protein DXG03_005545 [Asterophora parasitica]|uniref:Uncharacterized protein n=1 Tax=Asterophora parasitica TaxID=117018 RepID=A0A9P7FZC5_9AGAR|nr:hypothetical protein DXG03_005545 [Asterophora parasitica]